MVFTAKVEQDFDDIANGSRKWKETLKHFYDNFHLKIEDVEEHADRATGERLLGVDPKSGKNVYARMGRYGAMIQIGKMMMKRNQLTLHFCQRRISIPSVLKKH